MSTRTRLPVADFLTLLTASLVAGVVVLLVVGVLAFRYNTFLCWRYGIVC